MNLKKYLSSHKKTHLIFDFDRTIVRLLIPWEKWHLNIEDKLNKVDSKILSDFLNGKINLSNLQNRYISKYPKIKDDLISYMTKFELKFADGFEENKNLTKLIPALTNYTLFLWTSNTQSVVFKILKEIKLYDQFEKRVTRNDVTLVKPETDGFKLIHDKKVPLKNYLFIGDSGSDRGACKKIGIDFYHITHFGDTLHF